MTAAVSRVLLVDDDRDVRDALGQTLELADLEPVVVRSVIEAKDHVSREFAGVVVTDIRMPGKDGFALLQFAREVDPDLPVILLTGEADVPMAVRGMSEGAHAFLEKPCAPTELLACVRDALAARALVLKERSLARSREAGDAAARMLYGVSALAEDLRTRVRQAAAAGTEVLVTGAPGSGTWKVAEVIHLLSPRATGPFVKRASGGLDPAGLSEALDVSRSGSLFLDEVATLSPNAQFALLDALDTGTEARVIAGTYRDLADVPGFSADLALRLSIMPVRVPALAERKEDIPVLFRHYVAQACEQAALPMPQIGADVLARLLAQDWPGNGRSLMNAAMRFAMGMGEPAATNGLGLAEQMAQVERTLLAEALESTGGRAGEAAERLKLPRKTFYDKLARHGLKPEDYRSS